SPNGVAPDASTYSFTIVINISYRISSCSCSHRLVRLLLFVDSLRLPSTHLSTSLSFIGSTYVTCCQGFSMLIGKLVAVLLTHVCSFAISFRLVEPFRKAATNSLLVGKQKIGSP
ncbi:hypothetical protein, partial [Rhodopirellula bahusiensis]|uniref:hypothetical protein n=1 Tax=Rhodopirellula bahusiensis TaxID=2014065 RepID=UPI0032636479